MGSSQISHFPELETERLILRYLALGDIEFVVKHFSDPAVCRFLLDEDPVSDRGEAEEIIRHYLDPAGKTHNRWGIVLKSSNEIIGTCGFHKWDQSHNRAEVGYDLGPDFWGHGLMKEALSEAFRHGFSQMDLNRIDALVYSDNERSIGLLTALGFREEGVLREYFLQAGRYYDHSIYSLLKSEYAKAG